MINKEKILYEKIDPEIREIIRLLNLLDFCATFTSCQGHVTKRYEGKPSDSFYQYTADLFVKLEVYNEKEFLKLTKFLQQNFYKRVNWWLNISKHFYYDQSLPPYEKAHSFYDISIIVEQNDPKRLEGILDRARSYLKHRLEEWSEKNGKG